MGYGVEVYRNFDNKLCCDLTDFEFYLPRCGWLTAYLRDFEVFRTALSYAYQAKYNFEYFDARCVDLIDRVESGAFFTKSRASGLSKPLPLSSRKNTKNWQTRH